LNLREISAEFPLVRTLSAAEFQRLSQEELVVFKGQCGTPWIDRLGRLHGGCEKHALCGSGG